MQPVRPDQGFSITRNPRNRSSIDWKILAICAGFAIVLLTTFYFFRSKPVIHKPVSVQIQLNENSDFDRTLSLPGDPEGLAWNGSEFVTGNRLPPLGFIKIVRDEAKDSSAQQVEVRDENNERSVHIWTVTWNGKNYIGYTEGKNFDPHSRFVFTVHDSKTFEVIHHYPAPEMVGGLVWDGTGYWVATRENTRNSADAVYLYRYDPDFKVVNRTKPPGRACEGLAWDGSNLWFADTYSSMIYLLNVTGNDVKTVHRYRAALRNMSGIGFDGEDIWVGDYDDHQIHRLNPVLRSMWNDGDFHVGDYAMARQELGGEEESQPEVAKSPGVLLQPETEQKPLIGQQPVFTFDRSGKPYRVDSFLGSYWGTAVYGSWSIYFSEEMFANQPADPAAETFVRYSVYVMSWNPKMREVQEFDATAGANSVDRELLVSELPPGKYGIQLLIQAKYADAEGKIRSIYDLLPPQLVSSEDVN